MTTILREVEGESALSANTLNLALSRYDDGKLYVEATLTANDGSKSWGESLPLSDVLAGGIGSRRPRNPTGRHELVEEVAADLYRVNLNQRWQDAGAVTKEFYLAAARIIIDGEKPHPPRRADRDA